MQRFIVTTLVALAPMVAQAQTSTLSAAQGGRSVASTGATLSSLPSAGATGSGSSFGFGGSGAPTLGDTGTPTPAPGPDTGDGGGTPPLPTDGSPGVVEGGSSLDLANALESTLAALQNDAQNYADEAAAVGDDGDAQALSSLVQDASTLAQQLEGAVIVPLTKLAPIPGIEGSLQRLGTSFDAIDYDLSNMSDLPQAIADEVSTAHDLRDQLDAALLASERDRPTRGN